MRRLLKLVLLLLRAAAGWSVWDLQLGPATFSGTLSHAADFLGRIFPLTFPPPGEVLAATALTFSIVLLATVLAVALSLPLAVLAASNTAPGPTTRLLSRAVIVGLRAVPGLILVIVFFRLFGLGGLPGVLAIGISSVGMTAKLYADAIEQVDPGPAEALRTTGAGRWQVVVGAVIPQVMPQIVATGLHRFDINLRVSVILGYVGVAGLGTAVALNLNTRNYSGGVAWTMIILVLCVLTELVSARWRARLLRRSVDRRRLPTRARALLLPGAVGLLALAWVGARMPVGVPELELTAVWQVLGTFLPSAAQGLEVTLWAAMLETVQIALAGTLLGAVVALPVGILAADNVTGRPRVRTFCRGLIVAVRAIPDLVLAIFLIIVTGLGAVPGTIALAVGSVGMLSKLVADSIEETDTRVQEAVRSTGANRVQVLFTATLPQALPAFVSHVLFQLDSNVRAATLLGIVGAGGIGFYLLNAARVLEFGAVTYMLLMIVLVVLAIEGLSMWVRRALIR